MRDRQRNCTQTLRPLIFFLISLFSMFFFTSCYINSMFVRTLRFVVHEMLCLPLGEHIADESFTYGKSHSNRKIVYDVYVYAVIIQFIVTL